MPRANPFMVFSVCLFCSVGNLYYAVDRATTPIAKMGMRDRVTQPPPAKSSGIHHCSTNFSYSLGLPFSTKISSSAVPISIPSYVSLVRLPLEY
ncbi:hypothetical protein BDY21DRAFT_211489 [Lineolata rhizophorae]|uniref:Secreted protein n=1 Tax=Lineolata rhizophorae TaxID=578093 RepID=A0A6A6P4Q0_9PEZI|nr:hypothetical protein BDY21DRAFT_211489 [Lineolata rhizophorae]